LPTAVNVITTPIAEPSPAPSKPVAAVAVNHRAELPRSPRLIGTWQLQEAGGGTLEFNSDGTAKISAPLIIEKPLELTSRWFVVGNNGDTFDLEIGAEPFRTANHQLRIVLDGDSTLRLIKYADSAALSARERIFGKR